MPAKVTLTVIEGHLKGQTFQFTDRTTCIVGRAHDCHPQLPNDLEHRIISRYHCLFDINPPQIRVRDFGSLNGTYVNGKKIGQRPPNQEHKPGSQLNFQKYDLQEGDEIKLGKTVFKVSIEVFHEPEVAPIPALSWHERIHALIGAATHQTTSEVAVLPQNGENSKGAIASTATLPAIQVEYTPLSALEGYTPLKSLGKGRFGDVYLARHDHTGEEVCLKIMQPQQIPEPLAIEMFLRELDKTKALHHTNILQLKDYRYADGCFFLIMEYCNGGTLHDLIQQRGGLLSIEEAVSIVLQILDGLEYAQNAKIPSFKPEDVTLQSGCGLVHRNLNPANIFLANINGKQTVKIGDYGLVKAFDLAGLNGLSMSDSIAGIPYFMPRQQVLNFKYVKPEVDIWSTAATLYFMLTGKYPRNFNGHDPLLVVLQTNAVPIWERDASIPRRLADVINQALIDKPEIHFKMAADFKRALLSVV